MPFLTKIIEIKSDTPIIPVQLDNSKVIKQVAVFFPTGATGRVSLRNVNEIMPFYNRAVGGETEQGGLANHYIKVETSATDVEGYIELDEPSDFIANNITLSFITS